MNLTTFLAAWGALVSTAVAAWTISRDIRDRAKLQLDVMIGNIIQAGQQSDDFLLITITNVGRRPVVVKNWALHYKKQEGQREWGIIIPEGLPRLLREGEYHMEHTPELERLTDGVTGISVFDSAGREWKVTKKQLESVVEDARRALLEKKKLQVKSSGPGN